MAGARAVAFARAHEAWLLRGLLAIAQVTALFWFAVPTGLPLDDAWIHQVVARTFAESGTLGYAPGEHGAAATSYLWAALLAVNFKVVHVSPVRWAAGLNFAAALVTGQALLALLRRGSERESGRAGMAFVGALLACLGGNVLWYAHSGMEASLFLALSTTALWAVTAPEGGARMAWLAGIAGGLVALTRPEGAPLCGLLLLYVVVRRQGLSRIAAVVVPAALSGALYLGSNLLKAGHATPTTLSGRRWLWFETTSGLSWWDRAADFAEAWVERLSSYTFDSGPLVAWLLLALAAYGAFHLLRARNDGLRLLFAWAALHTVAYVFMLPTTGHGGRYQPFVPLLFGACIAIGSVDLVRAALKRWPRAARAVSLAAVLPWLVYGFATAGTLRHAHALAVAHIDGTEIATGRYLDTLPKGVIASFDIGGIGWAAHRPVLDAGGLSDPRTASLLERGRIWEYLKSHDVRYVVLPEAWEHVLPTVDRFVSRLHLDNPAVKLTALHVEETPFELWLPAIAATWNAAPKQVVYEIAYTGEKPPDDVPLVAPDARRALRDDASLVRARERKLTEHALAVLASWGAPLSVRLTAASSTPEVDAQACAVDLGSWGLAVAGCTSIGEPALVRSVLYEMVGRYLDAGDLPGALRALPQAVVAAKRLSDPRFHPPIAPIMPPGNAPRDRTLHWGIPLALGLAALLVLLERGAAGLLLRKLRGRVPSSLAASSAALALTVVGAALGGGGCGRPGLPSSVSLGKGAVDQALDAGANVEERDGHGRTALMLASERGDLDVVRMLLAREARADARDDDDATALHHAARGGHAACALALVNALGAARLEAAIDAKAGPRRRTALHDAAIAGSLQTVQALLGGGADATLADSFGETALHLLARAEPSRAAGIASYLLPWGKNVSTRLDARGFTAAHAAAAVDALPMLKDLAAAHATGEPSARGESPADTAMRYGQDRAADLLIRTGSKLSDPEMLSPLEDAARMGDVARYTRLLAEGANPLFMVDGRGRCALVIADRHHTSALLPRSWPITSLSPPPPPAPPAPTGIPTPMPPGTGP